MTMGGEIDESDHIINGLNVAFKLIATVMLGQEKLPRLEFLTNRLMTMDSMNKTKG